MWHIALPKNETRMKKNGKKTSLSIKKPNESINTNILTIVTYDRNDWLATICIIMQMSTAHNIIILQILGNFSKLNLLGIALIVMSVHPSLLPFLWLSLLAPSTYIVGKKASTK